MLKLPKIGIPQRATTLIITSELGSHMHPENFDQWWRKYAKRNDLEGVSLHQLRHTLAKLMISKGVDPKTVQYLSGHADPALTMKLYTHYVPNNGTAAMQTLSGTLYGELDEAENIDFEAIVQTA